MARVTAEKVELTRSSILEAAREVLQEQGFANLSTRSIATTANVPLSQIQYHFGSKDGLLLSLYEHMNNQLLDRQTRMFSDPNLSFSEKWNLACDFLDADIDSGYVRVFQELTAAGWSNPDIGDAVRHGIVGWFELLQDQAQKYLSTHELIGSFKAKELAALVSAVFVGAESAILLGLEDRGIPYRQALRRFGTLLDPANKLEGV